MRERAIKLFKQYYGQNASFREGQLEAIESTYNNPRTLVVQKTGWGKSLVYFLSTKLFKEDGKGLTLVISPLLVLMENQKEAAVKLGIKCASINYMTKDELPTTIQRMKSGDLDLVFVTPESLFKEDLQQALPNIKIGLFVIDEAHCISDWGHDFRKDYGKLNKVIKVLPSTVHILATTATANDRVVEDLKEQLGNDVYISRGHLSRDTLHINIVKVKDTAERYAWILKNINKLPGSGIIYCLTTRDCDYLADFLKKNGISALSYHSGSQAEELENMETIHKFINNEIKVVVATIKLGMGFDKGDIGFVIHYQMPSNIVSYYQQIGRAGRNIDKAYAILMSGPEDKDIIDYFINTAFPTREECDLVLDCLNKHNGLSVPYICGCINKKKGRIEKAVSFLENEGAIFKEGSKYYVSANKYTYNEAHYKKVTDRRIKERDEMFNLLKTRECLNKYIIGCLDDKEKKDCGRCSNCTKEKLFDNDITMQELENALSYINNLEMVIVPRKQWPSKDFFDTIKIHNQLLPGIVLSKYNDVGYGKLVKKGKYEDKRFCDELVGKSASILKDVIKEHNIKYITCVPSLRSNIVKDFTLRLAESLKLEFVDALSKKDALQQKKMENSYFQCRNAVESFEVNDYNYSGNILLVDDMVDSKWTITVCGHYLMEAGFESVFPYALADSSQSDGDGNE